MDSFTITLTTDELNTVLDALGGLPYRDSAPVVAKIIGQAQTQANQQQDPVATEADDSAS